MCVLICVSLESREGIVRDENVTESRGKDNAVEAEGKLSEAQS